MARRISGGRLGHLSVDELDLPRPARDDLYLRAQEVSQLRARVTSNHIIVIVEGSSSAFEFLGELYTVAGVCSLYVGAWWRRKKKLKQMRKTVIQVRVLQLCPELPPSQMRPSAWQTCQRHEVGFKRPIRPRPAMHVTAWFRGPRTNRHAVANAGRVFPE